MLFTTHTQITFIIEFVQKRERMKNNKYDSLGKSFQSANWAKSMIIDGNPFVYSFLVIQFDYCGYIGLSIVSMQRLISQ